jgi:hypothetical protein
LGAAVVCVAGVPPAAAAPVVVRALDPVGPGETALLFGDGIGPDATAEGLRLPDEQVSNLAARRPEMPSGPAQPLEVLQASDVCAKVLIPADWKPGMYAIRLRNQAGVSDPVFLNRTDPWWWLAGPNDSAASGQEIRVFGKCLGPQTQAWLSALGKAEVLTVVKADKYAVTFRLPASAAPGTYDLWLSNGFGGVFGLADPLKIPIVAPDAWPAGQYDVRDCGAAGDGVADDTGAFAAALARAETSGGGVVFVPRGTYKVTAKMVIPPCTVVRGQSRDGVWIYTPKDLPEIEAVFAGNGDFAIEDLSIVSQTARRLVVCPDHKAVYDPPWGHSPPPEEWGRGAALRRLRLQHLRYAHRVQGREDPRRLEATGPSTVVLAGPDMELSDCEIVSSGMPIALHDIRHCRIERNRLETGRNGWYGLWNIEESVFEGNVIQARDLEGSYGGVQNKAWRLYIAGNRWSDAYGGEREALTFDTPYYPTWMGRLGAVQGATLTTREHNGTPKKWTPDELKGQVCLIAYGKGLGQYVRIAGNTDAAITLEQPFAVAPDATSHLVVRVNKTDVVITGNTFADASAAVQLYAQSFGFIIDGNKAQRTGGMYGLGFDAWDQRQRHRYSTCCFNQWLNNELSQGFVYQQGAFLHGVLGPCAGGSAEPPPAITTIGNVVRNNTVRDHVTVGALQWGPHPFEAPESAAGYFGRDTIIENNTIADTPLALEVYPVYVDTVLRGNRLENCAVPLRDDGANTWIHPAERLGYQVQAVKTLLGTEASVESIEKAVADLAKGSAVSVEAASRCARLHGQLWAEVARCRPRGTTPGVLAALVGLHTEFDAASSVLKLLSVGKAGRVEVRSRARTEPWAPAVAIAFETLVPRGWQGSGAGGAFTVRPAEIAGFKSVLAVPAQAGDRWLPVRWTVTLGGASLFAEDRFDVGTREILNWMVIGPFANPNKALPDMAALPAERRFDLKAEYTGLSGKVRWQAATLPDKYLHLDKMPRQAQAATALAVTCLRAEKAATVALAFSCRGSLAVWLDSRLLLTLGGPGGGRSVQVRLEPGEHTLLCKSSVVEGAWEIAVDLKDLSADPTYPILQVPLMAQHSTRPPPL